jgi:hypothetical protein
MTSSINLLLRNSVLTFANNGEFSLRGMPHQRAYKCYEDCSKIGAQRLFTSPVKQFAWDLKPPVSSIMLLKTTVLALVSLVAIASAAPQGDARGNQLPQQQSPALPNGPSPTAPNPYVQGPRQTQPAPAPARGPPPQGPPPQGPPPKSSSPVDKGAPGSPSNPQDATAKYCEGLDSAELLLPR